jgi:hypothetical protein
VCIFYGSIAIRCGCQRSRQENVPFAVWWICLEWKTGGVAGNIRDIFYIFQAHNKKEETCVSSFVKVSELQLWWICRSSEAFPTLSGSAYRLPFGCQSRVSLPPFFIEVFHLYLKEPRVPLEPPLWYDRFSWQSPIRVTCPVPPEHYPFSYCPPVVQRVGLLTVSLPVFFQPRGLLFPFRDPGLSVGGFHLTGD